MMSMMSATAKTPISFQCAAESGASSGGEIVLHTPAAGG